LVVVPDFEAAATHAAGLGLITADGLAQVVAASQEE
jgi:hypothetical protein